MLPPSYVRMRLGSWGELYEYMYRKFVWSEHIVALHSKTIISWNNHWYYTDVDVDCSLILLSVVCKQFIRKTVKYIFMMGFFYFYHFFQMNLLLRLGL